MTLSLRKLATLIGVLLISAPFIGAPVSAKALIVKANYGNRAQGGDLQISLLTFGPGRIYWERFGHDAILVRNLSNDMNIDYNYGVFDFDQKNFFLNFARGKMTYRISADLFSADLAIYKDEGRSVTQQILNLTPSQRALLNEYLEWNSLPQNARYHYDYFKANCATRVRDALNLALNGALRRELANAPAPHGDTYRTEAVRLISPDLWFALGMDLALGPPADKPLSLWQAAFIPMVLSRALNQVRLLAANGRSYPLVAKTRVLLRTQLAAPARLPHWALPLAATGLGVSALLIFLAGQLQRTLARIIFGMLAFVVTFFCAIGGLVLVVLWAWTDHWATWGNHNLLLLNPACILLLPCWFAASRKNWQPRRWHVTLAALIAGIAATCPLLHILPMEHQDNMKWILLILPIHLALLVALTKRKHPAIIPAKP